MKFESGTAYEVVPLEQLIELIIDHRGKTPKKLGGDFTDKGVPVISAIHIKNGQIQWDERERYVSGEMFERWMPIKLQIDDVLLTSEAPLGETALVPSDEDLVLSQRLFAIRCKKEILDPTYFKYFLTSPGGQKILSDRASGSTVMGIRQAELVKIAVPHPDIQVQRVVGKILLSIDEKIQSNIQLSKTLEDIAQTIFKSWFIDFDPVKAKMAGEKPVGMDDATAALFPDSMEDSELGLKPKGWEIESLFDFGLEIESGSRPKGGVKGIVSGVPSIGAESINGLGVFEFSKTKYISEEFYEKMNKGKPKDFDVLLYKDGGKPGEFKPRVGMFGLGFPFERCAVNEHVFLLRATKLGQPFMYFWVCLERTLDILRNRGIKAAIPGINQQDVGTIPVLFPGKEILDKFDEICFPYIQLILTLASESLELTKLRDSLLPRLISGELQIPEEMLAS